MSCERRSDLRRDDQLGFGAYQCRWIAADTSAARGFHRRAARLRADISAALAADLDRVPQCRRRRARLPEAEDRDDREQTLKMHQLLAILSILLAIALPLIFRKRSREGVPLGAG